jgi:amino acid transporter
MSTVDRGLFGRISKTTQTPLYAVWIVVLVSFLPGLLDLASPVAANAIFSLTAMGMYLPLHRIGASTNGTISP